MKLERGQLARLCRTVAAANTLMPHYPQICVVLGIEEKLRYRDNRMAIYYKVYVIEEQCTRHVESRKLLPINPREPRMKFKTNKPASITIYIHRRPDYGLQND